MEIQLTITLSDRLFGLLEDKLPNLGNRFKRAITKEVKAQVENESSVAVAVVASPSAPAAETHVAEGATAAKATEVVVSEMVVVPSVAESPKESPLDSPKEITPEEARAAIGEARRRLLGEDYEAQKGTPKYKAITALAKQSILIVSEGRAQNIPSLTAEERKRFIEDINSLVLDENGQPSFPSAPF